MRFSAQARGSSGSGQAKSEEILGVGSGNLEPIRLTDCVQVVKPVSGLTYLLEGVIGGE